MATQAFIQKNIQYQNPSSTSTFSEFRGSNSFNFTGTQLLQRSKYFRAQEHNFWAGSRFTSPNGVRSTGLLVGSAKHSILWSSFDLGKHLKTATYCGHAYTTGTDRPKNVWESPTDLPIIYPTKLKKPCELLLLRVGAGHIQEKIPGRYEDLWHNQVNILHFSSEQWTCVKSY